MTDEHEAPAELTGAIKRDYDAPADEISVKVALPAVPPGSVVTINDPFGLSEQGTRVTVTPPTPKAE